VRCVRGERSLVLKGIFMRMALLIGLLAIFAGCTEIQKVRHFYLGYGEKGYLHLPSMRPNQWTTVEVEAPPFKAAPPAPEGEEEVLEILPIKE